ncbi:MAG: BRO family protein, partial [Sphingobium sp.]|nr:BRO family protein [Sphingobium sp.]
MAGSGAHPIEGQGQKSSAIVPFAYGEQLVRVVEIDAAPWWVAGDVARVLGYSATSAMLRVLDDDEKGVQIVHPPYSTNTPVGGQQKLAIISESGLYHAILKSRRAEAKAFRKWVTAQVLPAIRRNGGYAIDARSHEMDAMRRRPVSEKAETERARRMATLSFLEERLAEGEGVNAAVRAAAQWAGVAQSTVWNWRALVRMVREADRPHALTPQYVGGGRQADIHPDAWMMLTRLLSRSDASFPDAVTKVRAAAQRHGWTPIPHDKTLYRRIRALMQVAERERLH